MTSSIPPKKSQRDIRIHMYSLAISELAFVFVPFIALIIGLSYNIHLETIFEKPEWSVASSVMFGQSITKFLQVLWRKTQNNREVDINKILAFISLIVILGIIPSSITLVLMIITADPPMWLKLIQMVLFASGCFIFLFSNISLAKSEMEDPKS